MYNVYQCVDSGKAWTFIPAGTFATRHEAVQAAASIRMRTENGKRLQAGIWTEANRLVQQVF